MPGQDHSILSATMAATGDHEGEMHDTDNGTGPDVAEFFLSMSTDAQGWWDAQKRLFTLRAYEKAGHAAGLLLQVLLTSVAVVMIVIFASLALAVWLGNLMNGLAWGLLTVAGMYIVLLLLAHFVIGPKARRLITLRLINSLYDDEEA